MKKKSRMIGVLLASVLILGTGCGKKENTTKEKEEIPTVEGVYLTYGEEQEFYIFADIKNETLFEAEIPDGKLFDRNLWKWGSYTESSATVCRCDKDDSYRKGRSENC